MQKTLELELEALGEQVAQLKNPAGWLVL